MSLRAHELQSQHALQGCIGVDRMFSHMHTDVVLMLKLVLINHLTISAFQHIIVLAVTWPHDHYDL